MSQPDVLPPEERAWLVADEARWAKAHRIVRNRPDLDVGGVYRVLRNLEKPPAARLKAALAHGRLFGLHRR